MENLFDMDRLGELITTYAPKVVGAILTLIIGFMVIGWITKTLRRVLNKQDVDPSLVPFLVSLISILLKIMLVLSVAQMFGVATTSFVAILSALAFAIGMAMQGSLGHFASGVLILFFKPFRVGDAVKLGDYIGSVKEIRMFNTVLSTLDERTVIIPNGIITDNPIENFTVSKIRKIPMTFGVGYGDDIDHTREVLRQVVNDCPHILHDKPVDILVEELAGSSVNFTVRPYVKSEKYWDAYFWLNEHVKKALDNAGINIPFPQMDVHIQNQS